MTRIFQPVMCATGRDTKAKGFVKAEIHDGEFSMTGVIGPYRSGNCQGAAGQCVNEIRNGEPANGWTREMVDQLCDLWERWHLNYMRMECQHQRELGWREIAKEVVKLPAVYTFQLDRDTISERSKIDRETKEKLLTGECGKWDEDELTLMSLPYSCDMANDDAPPAHYKLIGKKVGSRESDVRGHILYKENELGLLGKPCPVCGYGYGSKWMKEELTDDVIQLIASFPSSTTKPAWI